MPAIMHSYADRKDDFYPTPIEAVRAFMAAEADYLPQTIWECACGDGAIVVPMRAAGFDVHATDLVDRGCPDSHGGVDFLLPFAVPDHVEGIVTNPPFKLANAFVARACSIAPYVAMLARLAFLEGNERRELFRRNPPARIHVSSRRLPMMHRDGWEGPISTSTTCFAWFVWDRRWQGEPVIRWFDWKESADGFQQRSGMGE